MAPAAAPSARQVVDPIRLFDWPTRFLQRFLGLERADVSNLTALYLATFVMRAAAFAGVAVMQDVILPEPGNAFWHGLLFAVYPIAEIATVGYFGARCDERGRKRVLIFAHVITAAAVFLFIVGISSSLSEVTKATLVAVFFAMFGIGAGAKVASTLAMVNDHTSLVNRAQLMAVFDLVTFGGLAAGFGAGFLALSAFGWSPEAVLLVGGVGVLISVVLVQFFVQDAKFSPAPPLGTVGLLMEVFRNRDIVRLLPVYIPVVALYGYVLTFTDQIIGSHGGGGPQIPTMTLLVIVLAFGVPLAISLVAFGRWSDIARLRRPFMLIGLGCFGGLAILFSLATRPGGGMDPKFLYDMSPWIAAASFGAGTFPPAALAYLGDVIDRSISGTSFGIYSLIFGTGLIVGPILGGTVTQTVGALSFALIALSLIAISAFSVIFFLREPARSGPSVPAPATPSDPPDHAK
ncbi:MAG TPA: MFS transporter [Thermoplasmata archaeon]|nr:MFS transporter [Thermoplasmata archaeon]